MHTRSTALIAIALSVGASPILARGAATADFAVGPQYDTAHAYVAPDTFDAFTRSVVATFGGTLNPQGVFQATPTPSKTKSQLLLTPVGTISAFGFLTPVPYPFGSERSGYLVTDLDAAVAAAVRHGAIRLVTSFPDPIGRDAVVQWPGGVSMQFYWHITPPRFSPLESVPENRIYVTRDAADAFLKSWRGYAHAKIIRDAKAADASEIGEPGTTYRRISLTSGYGRMVVHVSDGHLPWPYGYDSTGYEVSDLQATLARASAAGVEVLVPPYDAGDRRSAIVRFPGGYIAEIHSVAGP